MRYRAKKTLVKHTNFLILSFLFLLYQTNLILSIPPISSPSPPALEPIGTPLMQKSIFIGHDLIHKRNKGLQTGTYTLT